MFVGTSTFVGVGDRKVYRVNSDTITGMKFFNSGQNSGAYGVFFETNLLVVSLDSTNSRRIYDYTTGFSSGTNSFVQMHPKTHFEKEVGITSPEDGRPYYFTVRFTTRVLLTLKQGDGSVWVSHTLTGLGGDPMLSQWIKDTDLCVVPSWGDKFVIVNFMDQTNPGVKYFTLPHSAQMIFNPFVWTNYKAILAPSVTAKRSYLYKALTEMPCSDLCGTCDGVFRKKCLTCKPNSSPAGGDTCSCNTNQGFYESKISYTTKECKACSPLCGTCSGGAATDCTTCKYSYMEKKGDGSCGCPAGSRSQGRVA